MSGFNYQQELFHPVPQKEFICNICFFVFYIPVETPCRHVFCKSCISRWAAVNRTCPVCRKIVSTASLRDVAPMLKSLILQLTIRCTNREQGCEEISAVEFYESHLRRCPFQKVICPNEVCSAEILLKDQQEHEYKECVFSLVLYIDENSSGKNISEGLMLMENRMRKLGEEVSELLRETDDWSPIVRRGKQTSGKMLAVNNRHRSRQELKTLLGMYKQVSDIRKLRTQLERVLHKQQAVMERLEWENSRLLEQTRQLEEQLRNAQDQSQQQEADLRFSMLTILAVSKHLPGPASTQPTWRTFIPHAFLIFTISVILLWSHSVQIEEL